jgi:hypothetical protein
MGKYTISMAMLNSFFYAYQRGYPINIPIESLYNPIKSL